MSLLKRDQFVTVGNNTNCFFLVLRKIDSSFCVKFLEDFKSEKKHFYFGPMM